MRKNGKIILAEGFVPNGGVSSLSAVLFGKRVRGRWRNDFAMLEDPTVIGYEIPVDEKTAEEFIEYHTLSKSGFENYSLHPCDVRKEVNCVSSAVAVIAGFFYAKKPAHPSIDMVNNLVFATAKNPESKQGHLIIGMLNHFLPCKEQKKSTVENLNHAQRKNWLSFFCNFRLSKNKLNEQIINVDNLSLASLEMIIKKELKKADPLFYEKIFTKKESALIYDEKTKSSTRVQSISGMSLLISIAQGPSNPHSMSGFNEKQLEAIKIKNIKFKSALDRYCVVASQAATSNNNQYFAKIVAGKRH